MTMRLDAHWMPFTANRAFKRAPRLLVAAKDMHYTAEDGREMHKSWGNAIEFNEAADKIGVDVMRWLYAGTPPERNVPPRAALSIR